MRRDEPERARVLLDILGPWPLFKAAQFLFDLMEWEDFMVDGEPPPLLPLDRTAVLDLPLSLVRAVARASLDGLPGGWEPVKHAASSHPTTTPARPPPNSPSWNRASTSVAMSSSVPSAPPVLFCPHVSRQADPPPPTIRRRRRTRRTLRRPNNRRSPSPVPAAPLLPSPARNSPP
ncbi:hypothetical protein [Actinacidiphila oryziradicis]|uniref:Uncharacterized protein n=1 Tax=Actinacidiphila oryziradicis TaxID=2571141 RepID=A0A4U0T8M3_9ACTN|nr:hypothetical protein [Actinacidiphila oryziradicis]TKA11055.1 hypothetical protein FCI23_13970 [Actinacidiphila oryziradicis]